MSVNMSQIHPVEHPDLNSDQTTGMIPELLKLGVIFIPVELLLVLDLQDGRVVVQDGQDDFVHVLSQTQVDFLLLLQGFH